MYLHCKVKVPSVPGKISTFKKGNTAYVRYVVGRTYHPDKKYNIPIHKTIGKLVEGEPGVMVPNENFLKYFGDEEIPELMTDTDRSSCLRLGAYAVIKKIIESYGLLDILKKYFGEEDARLLLDFATYTIITEDNAAQYYPDYAYDHPLFTDKMHIYSDTKISKFFAGITDDQRIGFLNEWNANRDHRERIYISYDSTNKNCQAGDLSLVEFGHPKDDKGLPVFNYSIAYDTYNREPLFYEQYPGSIVDVSQLQYMLEKAQGYGYRHIGFILDRGYFCKENIQYMDECGYDFVMMVKGMNSLVRELILERKGTFEEDREAHIREHKVFGTTIRRKLYADDSRDRYFHLYYSDQKACAEKEQLEAYLERMKKCLDQWKGQVKEIADGFSRYYNLEIYDKDGMFLFATEKQDVIIEERKLCGYFVIVTSEKMTAREALELYKGRDVSEKLFRGDKSYLGNRGLRIQSDEAAAGKIFTEFIALIVRSGMYTRLKDEMAKLDKKPNYMTVPAAIRELEKIEMVKMNDGKYHIDHSLTSAQKTILEAFGMNRDSIKKASTELSDLLERCKEA